MSNTSQFEGIIQQIDALPLAELLMLKAKVDALVERKSPSLSQIGSFGSYQRATSIKSSVRDVDKENKDNSLKKFIELVNEWMADESDYDEKTYPHIETALNQNQISL